MVVRGHSAVSSPEIRGNLIGLDTGAVWMFDGDGIN